MPKKTRRSALILKPDEIAKLESISNSRSRAKRDVERAKILLYYHQKMQIKEIAKKVGVSCPSIYNCIDKALEMGADSAMRDLPRNNKDKIEITLEAKAWVTSLACTKPKDLGLAAETWSRQSLANYVREHSAIHHHDCLKYAAKATIHRILKENKLHPEKIKYYLEKRDPDFDAKMREVLIVYKEVQLLNEAASTSDTSTHLPSNIVTVCVDEKPGVQAISNKAPDLSPIPGKYTSYARDHEYIRHGTASILAGIDLHDGHVFAQVHHRHRSTEFIELLKEVDEYYPEGFQIRLILDNHSSHISKETRAFLSSKPGRFIYIHTPVHGSWLNLAETLFGKMARTFLKAIRVTSWDDLKERILKGVAEINNSPVVHQWTKFDALKMV